VDKNIGSKGGSVRNKNIKITSQVRRRTGGSDEADEADEGGPRKGRKRGKRRKDVGGHQKRSGKTSDVRGNKRRKVTKTGK
jgi:hypothetical protein